MAEVKVYFRIRSKDYTLTFENKANPTKQWAQCMVFYNSYILIATNVTQHKQKYESIICHTFSFWRSFDIVDNSLWHI